MINEAMILVGLKTASPVSQISDASLASSMAGSSGDGVAVIPASGPVELSQLGMYRVLRKR